MDGSIEEGKRESRPPQPPLHPPRLALHSTIACMSQIISNRSVEYGLESTEATDWLYHAEGGKHAIFRYRPSAAENDSVAGHFVLRIPKHDLAFAYAVYGNASADDAAIATDHGMPTVSDQETKSFLFQRDVVQPLLGRCYLDLPRSVMLPPMVCVQLYHQAIASGNIPPSRLQSWQMKSSKQKRTPNNSLLFNEGIKATLLRDYTTLIKHPRFPDQQNRAKQQVISVEIKPKAGYITSSPLVSPKNRCKYNRTRYSLQQELMQWGHVQKGWREKEDKRIGHYSETIQNRKPFTPSNYSPLDLFSGNASQIHAALNELSNNMQNNFRVFCNGTQIFGEEISPLEGESKTILDELIWQGTASDCKNHDDNMNANSILLDFVTSVVSKILHREKVLTNLLSMQLLDVIDGDGAIRVYDRLVHLCDGSNSKAEELLDMAMFCIDEKLTDKPRLCGSNFAISPYELPNCSILHQLIKENDNRGVPKDDSSHKVCVQLVEQLSLEGCIYLLQNWLLSLAMCDVSFFVTFQCLPGDEQCIIEECQSIENGGVMIYDGDENEEEEAFGTRTMMMIHYEIKMVDCDAKPAKKLRSRTQVEDKFQFIT